MVYQKITHDKWGKNLNGSQYLQGFEGKYPAKDHANSVSKAEAS